MWDSTFNFVESRSSVPDLFVKSPVPPYPPMSSLQQFKNQSFTYHLILGNHCIGMRTLQPFLWTLVTTQQRRYNLSLDNLFRSSSIKVVLFLKKSRRYRPSPWSHRVSSSPSRRPLSIRLLTEPLRIGFISEVVRGFSSGLFYVEFIFVLQSTRVAEYGY